VTKFSILETGVQSRGRLLVHPGEGPAAYTTGPHQHTTRIYLKLIRRPGSRGIQISVTGIHDTNGWQKNPALVTTHVGRTKRVFK
jgi:hypothetical protein